MSKDLKNPESRGLIPILILTVALSSSTMDPDGPSSSSKKRRQYYKPRSANRNPVRGPPGILFTCQQGLEQRCRQDAMDLLHHDWDVWREQQMKNTTPDPSAAADSDPVKNSSAATGNHLSLDDELKQLKGKKNQQSEKAAFHLFETKCKGVVILVCTAYPPLVDPYQHGSMADAAITAPPQSKRPRHSDAADETTPKADISAAAPTTPADTAWDPLQAIQRITADAAAAADTRSSRYPSSRYIARLLPFQASCYPSLAELQHTLQSLLRRQQHPAQATFAIRIQRRLCNTSDASLTRPVLIDAMASILLRDRPQWTVDLDDPTIVVQLELCQTIACVALCSASLAAVRITEPIPTTPGKKQSAGDTTASIQNNRK